MKDKKITHYIRTCPDNRLEISRFIKHCFKLLFARVYSTVILLPLLCFLLMQSNLDAFLHIFMKHTTYSFKFHILLVLKM